MPCLMKYALSLFMSSFMSSGTTFKQAPEKIDEKIPLIDTSKPIEANKP